ncbi:hypothetical protein BU16DRAFT_535980 [Lophium mytilinum]|uniref:Uncharacterized protein n=1 Tax=Lophium mytilinum TaxID=390894 RepID=A0A6A6R5A8_9PEZI|nr:hypothetical protein BU16DRAFT_535980 [Lophium mytilinum]
MSKHRFTEKTLELEEFVPKRWFFEIYEDKDPEEICARIRYVTDRAIERIDLGGRQRNFRTEVGWNKENEDPGTGRFRRHFLNLLIRHRFERRRQCGKRIRKANHTPLHHHFPSKTPSCYTPGLIREGAGKWVRHIEGIHGYTHNVLSQVQV